MIGLQIVARYRNHDQCTKTSSKHHKASRKNKYNNHGDGRNNFES